MLTYMANLVWYVKTSSYEPIYTNTVNKGTPIYLDGMGKFDVILIKKRQVFLMDKVTQ